MTARWAFLAGLVGFFLLGGAWAVALPVNGTYDEGQHIVRAYAAFDGQWPPRGPDHQTFTVPATLLPANPECMHENKKAYQPASCLRPRTERGRVPTETYVARYNPVYYLAVGLPIRLWPNETGIVLARLLSALLCAAMLAAAVAIGVTLGSRLLVAAVGLVATPMVVNLAGSLNPNGLEICAAVLLFASGLALLRDGPGAGVAWTEEGRERSDRSDEGRRRLSGSGTRASGASAIKQSRALLACAAVAAFVLITVRHTGPVLLLVDLAALALLAGGAAVRATARRRDVWAWVGGGVLAGLVVFGGWVVFARSPVGAGPGRATDLGPAGILRGLVTDRFEFYVRQIVGQFGYGETTISPLAVLLWYALVAAVVLPAAWQVGWRVRAVLAGLLVAGFGMLVALEFYFVPTAGWFSHGRYALPVLAGAVLIAAATDPRPPRWWWPPALVLATAPVHLYALVRVLSRYREGIDASLSPFAGSWDPPVPAALALAAVLLGVVAVAACSTVAVRDELTTDNRASTRTVSAN